MEEKKFRQWMITGIAFQKNILHPITVLCWVTFHLFVVIYWLSLKKITFINERQLSPGIRFPTMWLCDQQRLRPACASSSLIKAFTFCLNILTVKLLKEQHVEFLSLTGGCTGSSESIHHVKMPNCWKSHVAAQLFSGNLTVFKYIYRKLEL